MLRFITKIASPTGVNGDWTVDSGTLEEEDEIPAGSMWLGMTWEYQSEALYVPSNPDRNVVVRLVTEGDNAIISQARPSAIIPSSNDGLFGSMPFGFWPLEAPCILRAAGNLSYGLLDPEEPDSPTNRVPIDVKVRFLVSVPSC